MTKDNAILMGVGSELIRIRIHDSSLFSNKENTRNGLCRVFANQSRGLKENHEVSSLGLFRHHKKTPSSGSLQEKGRFINKLRKDDDLDRQAIFFSSQSHEGEKSKTTAEKDQCGWLWSSGDEGSNERAKSSSLYS